MHVNIIVPFSTDGNIGRAYNRECERLPADGWVAFADYDICVCNPWWHDVLVSAVQTHGQQGGLFTCFTNRIGCKLQLPAGVDKENHDMNYHWSQGASLWRNHGYKCVDCTERGGRFSGMFLMTSRRAWEAVGGFKTEGLYHVDVDYYDRIKKAGLRTYLMAGLYVYHRYTRDTSTDLCARPLFERREDAIRAKGQGA